MVDYIHIILSFIYTPHPVAHPVAHPMALDSGIITNNPFPVCPLIYRFCVLYSMTLSSHPYTGNKFSRSSPPQLYIME